MNDHDYAKELMAKQWDRTPTIREFYAVRDYARQMQAEWDELNEKCIPLLGKWDDFIAQVKMLHEIILHCSIHSGFKDCGRDQMTAEQKSLYDCIVQSSP